MDTNMCVVLSGLQKTLLPHLSRVVIDFVERSATAIRMRARSRVRRGRCPHCGTTSGRVHGRYLRRLADAAWGGSTVVIELVVRRFKCVANACPAVTFAEQVEDLTRPDRLPPEQTNNLHDIQAACPHLTATAEHVRAFAKMLTNLTGHQHLPEWINNIRTDDLPHLQQFADGLRHDYDAVLVGLSSPWSSGQVEGQNTRAKLVKRIGYGRANFDLLRKRILLPS
ncbi:transposase [Micromonospora zamorensis]|uniref:transposase n=1 Tax=Micromonospora zamorensis TaxID=709883 RepID=UPI003CF3A465